MFGEVKSLRELFEIGVSYTFDCEKKPVEKGLPTMIEKAGSIELLRRHDKAQNQVERARATAI
jgi:hypothetical protein